MPIEVARTGLGEIRPLMQRQRAEANCQIVRDSILPRGLADPYVLRTNGAPVGFGGVWNRHFPSRLMAFFLQEDAGLDEVDALRQLLAASGATEMEAQSNMPGQFRLLQEVTDSATEEHLLFQAGTHPTSLEAPDGVFRRRLPTDTGPEGEWVVERDGRIVAAGGCLTHYNPPYADLYMEVVGEARGEGIGSYLVQELRRVCSRRGLVAAARCDPENVQSMRALERGGLVRCGVLCSGPVAKDVAGPREHGAATG